MPTYHVVWEMYYDVDSPHTALRHALTDLAAVTADPASGPNFFEVRDHLTGEGLFLEACDVELDLEAPDFA